MLRSLVRIAAQQIPLKRETKALVRRVTDYSVPPIPFRPNAIDPRCPVLTHYLNARIDKVYPDSEYHVPQGHSHITLDLEERPTFTMANSANNMHGGVVAMLHDLAACEAVSSLNLVGETLQTNIAYHAPIEFGKVSEVLAIGEVTLTTWRYCHVRSQIISNGNVASEATQIINVRPKDFL